MITYTNVLTAKHFSYPTHIPGPDWSVELLSIFKHCVDDDEQGWSAQSIQFYRGEGGEEHIGIVIIPLYRILVYVAKSHFQKVIT